MKLTPEQIELERSQFEARYEYLNLDRIGDHYKAVLTEHLWNGWLARAALAHQREQQLVDALQRVADWDPPMLLNFEGELVPFHVMRGTMGEINFMRAKARAALTAAQPIQEEKVDA